MGSSDDVVGVANACSPQSTAAPAGAAASNRPADGNFGSLPPACQESAPARAPEPGHNGGEYANDDDDGTSDPPPSYEMARAEGLGVNQLPFHVRQQVARSRPVRQRHRARGPARPRSCERLSVSHSRPSPRSARPRVDQPWPSARARSARARSARHVRRAPTNMSDSSDSSDPYDSSDCSCTDEDQPVRSATGPANGTTTGSSSSSMWRRLTTVFSLSLLKSKSAPPDEHLYQPAFEGLRQAQEAYEVAMKATKDANNEQKNARSAHWELKHARGSIFNLEDRLDDAEEAKTRAEESDTVGNDSQSQRRRQRPSAVRERRLQRAQSDIASIGIDLETARRNKRAAEAEVKRTKKVTADANEKANRLIEEAGNEWQNAYQLTAEINAQATKNIAICNKAVERALKEALAAQKAADRAVSSSSSSASAQLHEIAIDNADRKTHDAEKRLAELERVYDCNKDLLRKRLEDLRFEVGALRTDMSST